MATSWAWIFHRVSPGSPAAGDPLEICISTPPDGQAVCGPEGERTRSLTKKIRLGRVCAFCLILVFLLVRMVGWLAAICETALSNAWDL